MELEDIQQRLTCTILSHCSVVEFQIRSFEHSELWQGSPCLGRLLAASPRDAERRLGQPPAHVVEVLDGRGNVRLHVPAAPICAARSPEDELKQQLCIKLQPLTARSSRSLESWKIWSKLNASRARPGDSGGGDGTKWR